MNDTQYTLTEIEAYRAMTQYLEQWWKRSPETQVVDVLGASQLLEDGGTADPAAWDDWIKCVRTVIKSSRPIDE